MNKNIKKMKGFPRRLLALMLCCFCLLATVPVSAVALETGETQITEENTLEQQSESSGESLLSLLSEPSESNNETDVQQDTSDEIIEPITENETDIEVGTDTDTETGTENETGAETETETGTVAGAETETGTETGTENEMGAETETETGTKADTETEASADTEAEDKTGAEAETEAGAETDTETNTKAESETELEPVETEPNYLEQLNDYYEQAVAVGSGADNSVYAEIYNGTMAVYAAAGSPSAEDDPDVYNAVGMIVMTLQGYGYDPYAVSTLAEERNIKYYRGDVDVYWDETNGTTTASESHITSLKLNNMDVLKADSSKGSGWTGTPSQVGDYYASASTSNDQSVKLSITPADGYYVTRITVACCPASVAPYKCATWTSGLAYDNELSISAGGTISIDLSVVAFCHDNNNKEENHQYFILVQTAPLPSPLYVEYDYGEIVSILNNANLATTPFDAPGTWTSVGSTSDYYGSFTETDTLKFKQTENTQYMYRYADGDEDDAAKWTHTSNYVTEAAELAAASAGYYFSHWEAQYYEECTATAIANPTYNNYTYGFSEAYGNPVVYGEGEDVSMVTNVRLVAKWKPIELKVTKTVTGLAGSAFASESHTYTIQVQKLNATSGDWEDYSDALNFSITGDGTQTQTLSPITPGTYRAVETDGNGNLSNDTTIMYITVSDGGQVTYSTDNIQTSQEITVTNSYSSQPAAYNLTVQKTVSGNMYDASKEFAFTVTADKAMTYGETTDTTITFNLKKDEEATLSVPVGAGVTVSENPDGYTYSFVSITDGVEKTDAENGVSFTMPAQDVTVVINNDKTVTVDTGISLETLPYILILGVVAVGAVLLLRKRRVRDDY